MSDKPNTNPVGDAYIVPGGKEEDNKFWHKIASIFMHKDEEGFNIHLPPGVTVSGTLVCRIRKEKDKKA